MAERKKIAVAMSGGVDSSVAAYLLTQEGHYVSGVTFTMTSDAAVDPAGEAAAVCRRMGIPHRTVRRQENFAAQVIEPFVCAYEAGLTPNPCVTCNRYIKFPSALAFADAEGFDGAATGHYVRSERTAGRVLLKKGLDSRKDQSYVLWRLTQEMLARLWFPLGALSKGEVREIAASLGLACAKSGESQDICFIPDGNYAKFIRNWRGADSLPGDYIDADGNRLGEHLGQLRYTIGQRRGLGIGFGRHMYVTAKNAAANTVTLAPAGDDGAEPTALYTKILRAHSINLIACGDLYAPARLAARVRYHQKEAPAVAEQTGVDELTVTFDTPQRAVTPGQSLVLYDGDTVVGGGIITN